MVLVVWKRNDSERTMSGMDGGRGCSIGGLGRHVPTRSSSTSCLDVTSAWRAILMGRLLASISLIWNGCSIASQAANLRFKAQQL
jgi:hypothetical protein